MGEHLVNVCCDCHMRLDKTFETFLKTVLKFLMQQG